MKAYRWQVLVMLLVVVGPSCSQDDASGDASSTDAGVDEPAAPDGSGDIDAANVDVGAACSGATQQDLAGSCPKGLLCYPAPNGYCTATCGFADCPNGSVCVQSPSVGPLCARACTTDAQCRVADGYTCDKSWNGCVQWGVSPKLAACGGAAPPRVSFGAVTQLSTAAGPGSYHIEPGAAFDANGNLTTLFMARSELLEGSPLGGASISAAGQPTRDRTLKTSSKFAFDSWMARDRSGTLHAVWYGHEGFDTGAKIGYATSTDGATWTAERNLLDASDCPSTGCTDKPMIAVGPDPADLSKDVIYVVFLVPGGLRVMRSRDGGATFTKGAKITGVGVYGDVEVAEDGSVHVVGSAFAGTSDRLGDVANDVMYVKSTDAGQTFSPAKRVEDPAEPTPWYFSNPQVVFDVPRAKVYVAYVAGTADGKWNVRLATSADAGATFTRVTVNDDAPCANHATPAIAIEPANGKLHVVWIENRGGVGRVAYAACAPGGASCSANETISDQPFASYELVRNSPKWMGEYFALLIDPTGTKLHTVWAQPVSESAGVRSRIFHAARPL